MALYFVNKSAHEGSLNENLVSAHKSHPLVASAWSSPTSVLVTDNEGETLTVIREPATGAPATNKTLRVTALTWHPRERLLIIGWSNGKLSLWSMPSASELGIEDKDALGPGGQVSTAMDSLAAKAGVTTDVEGSVREHNAGAAVVAEWTEHGMYLVTCSSQKTVTVWVLEHKTTAGADRTAGTTKMSHTLKPLWSVESARPMVQVIHVPSNLPLMKMEAALDQAADTGKSSGSRGPVVAAEAPEDDDDGDKGLSSEDDLAFLLADGSDAVYALTDEQKITPCARQKEDIMALLYEPTDRLLVTLSSSHMIEAFRLGEDLSSASILRRKLSTPSTSAASGKFLLSMVWAGSGVVAFGCGDDRVRVFDVNNEVMYMVPFPQEGAHITYVATEIHRGMLAAGTTEGVVAVYVNNAGTTREAAGAAAGAKETSRLEDSSARGGGARSRRSSGAGVGGGLSAPRDFAKDWEPLATHQLGERTDRIVLNPLGDIVVSTGGGKHMQILHETERKRAWDGVAAATQISTNLVVIESVTGCQCLLESQGKIRGLSIAFPNIALWDGSKIDIYLVNEATSTFSLVNFVPTTSPAFALHREGLLYVKDGRIMFTTLQLQHLGHLAFAEAEGAPIVLDVMNDYMVAVSSKNYLRLARISARDLHPLGPSRPFVLHAQIANTKAGDAPDTAETLASAVPTTTTTTTTTTRPKGPIRIVAARVNAQGRRVALMTKIGTLAVPDTRIWVYDADTDKVSSFDFATRNEVPGAIYWNTPEPNASTIGELEYLLLACETHQGTMTRQQRQRLQQQQQQQAGAVTGEESTEASGNTSPSKANGKAATNREDLPELLPDMTNFAEQRNDGDDDRRGSLGTTNLLGNRTHNLVTLFATPRNGLAVHNAVPLKRYQICLVGLTIPDFLLSSVKINGNPSDAADYVVEQKRLLDFEGLKSDKDAAVREALMKFSYYSTMGNMDEAYRCIKTIKNPAAWQGLARMCVTSGRLDVAAVCLATMQDGVAARSLREAREGYPNDKNVQIAALACSLGMLEECEQFLRRSKRYDLITDVFLACGKFEHAQRHSERFDRMHIRPVAYKYAQFMESLQNMDLAIMWYYNAHCAGTDVPRIYYQSNRLHELRQLMNPSTTPTAPGGINSANASTRSGRRGSGASEDPRTTFANLFPINRDLLLWWAKHSERRRNLQDALHFYGLIKDTYNTVRLLCASNPPKIEAALEMVNTEVERCKAKHRQLQAADPKTAPPAPDRVGAAFFIGQFFERSGNGEKALQYYSHAGAYCAGVRVAKRLGRDSDALALALDSGSESLMLATAAYFEEKGAYDKAVELYRKVGATQCALDGCIKGSLFETLHEISTSLASAVSTDPAIFLNMASHFQSTGDYQKSVEMLVFAKRYDEALQLCQERSVTLTEDMAEAMTGENNTLPPAEKQALLLRVAQIAKDQGSWNLAGKKYTQAGERLKAMKMLMRGGDVDKVIFFANHSRNSEIYTLAGNFLQNQSWSTDANVYKSIVQFYTKAKAYESLVSFYDACAQFHIDENRNYSDALHVTEESVKVLQKASAGKAGPAAAAKTDLFKEKCDLLRSVVKAQQLVNSITPTDENKKKKSDEVINICSDIIKRSRPSHEDHDLIERTIRIGDVFALLVKFYFEKMEESRNALKVLESMSKHGVEPQYYVETDLIEQVCRSNNKKVHDVVPNAGPLGANTSTSTAVGRRRSSAATVNSDVAADDIQGG